MAQPQMMYAMSAVPQMPVKTEMVKGADMKENACEPKYGYDASTNDASSNGTI